MNFKLGLRFCSLTMGMVSAVVVHRIKLPAAWCFYYLQKMCISERAPFVYVCARSLLGKRRTWMEMAWLHRAIIESGGEHLSHSSLKKVILYNDIVLIYQIHGPDKAGNENKWSCCFPESVRSQFGPAGISEAKPLRHEHHTQNIIMVNSAPPHAGACTLRAILFGKFIWQWVSSLLLWIAIMSGETSLNLAISIAAAQWNRRSFAQGKKLFPSDGHRELKCIFGIFRCLRAHGTKARGVRTKVMPVAVITPFSWLSLQLIKMLLRNYGFAWKFYHNSLSLQVRLFQ